MSKPERDDSEPLKAKVFRNGRNQAIRIPVDLSFDTDTVTLEKRGDILIVRPAYDGGWNDFFADESLVLPEDFDTGEDPAPQERELE
jgi:virulence-associated protein VagC